MSWVGLAKRGVRPSPRRTRSVSQRYSLPTPRQGPCPCVRASFCGFVCLSVYLSIYLPICPSTHLSMCLYVETAMLPSTHQSRRPPVLTGFLFWLSSLTYLLTYLLPLRISVYSRSVPHADTQKVMAVPSARNALPSEALLRNAPEAGYRG